MLRASFFVTCLFALGFQFGVRGDVRYTVTRVGPETAPGDRALGINDNSEIVGGSSFGGWVQTAEGIKTLHDVADLSSINSGGVAVGWEGRVGIHPVIYDGNAVSTLTTLNGSATRINAAGVVIGASYLPQNANNRAFRYENGSITTFGTLGGTLSEAYGINDAGVIVGRSYLASGRRRAIRIDGSTMTDLGGLKPDGTSEAMDINASGQIVGSATAPDGVMHGALFSDGSVRDLGTFPDFQYTEAQAINDAGTIVGFCFSQSLIERAFVSHGSSLTDLNNLIDSATGWTLKEAWDINNLGQIVGEGMFVDPNNPGAPEIENAAYLLTPIPQAQAVPEPGVTVLIGCAGLSRGLRRQRRLKSPASAGS